MMGKKSIITIIVALLLGMCFASALSPLSKCEGKEQFAKIRVYIQDLFGNTPNATVWTVAQSPWINLTSTFFSQVRVMDSLMTAGIEYESTPVGRFQGEIVFSDFNDFVLTMNVNFYFTTGLFNGSSLVIVGRNPLSQQFNRTLPIVGGTGKLLNAHGYAILSSVRQGTDRGVLEYNLYFEYKEVSLDCLRSLDGTIKDDPFA